MSFCYNATIFNQQKVEDFNIKDGIKNPDTAYRIRTDWDSELDATKLLKAFFNDSKLGEIKNFVIGLWELEGCVEPTKIVDLILRNKDRLQHIKGIFFGDITYEENEVSWIQNINHGVILNAFPNLEVYHVRGGNELSLGTLNLPKLKKLVVETGGMGENIFKEISNANLPSLEHLELWCGSSCYGFNSTAEEVAAAYRGKDQNHLPSLKYLGLRNSELADEHALLFMQDSILEKIEILDLSKGLLGNVGAEALLNHPSIQKLRKLDLHHNFISDELATRLESIGIQINLDDRKPDADEDDRYVEVAE